MIKCKNCDTIKPGGVILVDNPSAKKPICSVCGRKIKMYKSSETLERVAMNIVYQIGDVLEADVDKRQATNDKAIDFTMKLIQDLLTNQSKEIVEKIEGMKKSTGDLDFSKFRNVAKDMDLYSLQCGSIEGWNKALSDIKALLEEK